MDESRARKIKAIFDPYYPAELSLWIEFARCIQVRCFRKNEIIKGYNRIERHINVVISGSVAHFTLAAEKDICISLYYENQMFSDYLSFVTQSPTLIKSQCLEDSEIWSISYPDLHELYRRSSKGILIGKAIADAMFLRKQTEQINLLTLSPIERYLKLLPIWALLRKV